VANSYFDRDRGRDVYFIASSVGSESRVADVEVSALTLDGNSIPDLVSKGAVDGLPYAPLLIQLTLPQLRRGNADPDRLRASAMPRFSALHIKVPSSRSDPLSDWAIAFWQKPPYIVRRLRSPLASPRQIPGFCRFYFAYFLKPYFPFGVPRNRDAFDIINVQRAACARTGRSPRSIALSATCQSIFKLFDNRSRFERMALAGLLETGHTKVARDSERTGLQHQRIIRSHSKLASFQKDY